jgi:hypothetical protein
MHFPAYFSDFSFPRSKYTPQHSVSNTPTLYSSRLEYSVGHTSVTRCVDEPYSLPNTDPRAAP